LARGEKCEKKRGGYGENAFCDGHPFSGAILAVILCGEPHALALEKISASSFVNFERGMTSEHPA
jgi:hypothetical protein